MNVEEYLQRINYGGSMIPSRENLDLLFRTHRSNIPSTNLDVFGGPRREFRLEDIFEFVVRRKRGGICYEVNSLFCWLLNQLGFQCTMIQSGFFFKELNKFGDKFTHMALLVTFRDCQSSSAVRYVVNLAYSDALPLDIEHSGAQIQQKGVFRVRREPDDPDCYYVERHKKSVLSLTGKVLKQGPGSELSSGIASVCSADCANPNSGHWTPAFRFSPLAHKMEDFVEGYKSQVYNPKSRLRNHLRMLLNNDRMSFKLVSETLSISVPSDSMTDRIIASAKVRSDDQVAGIVSDIFGLQQDFKIKYFDRLDLNKNVQQP